MTHSHQRREICPSKASILFSFLSSWAGDELDLYLQNKEKPRKHSIFSLVCLSFLLLQMADLVVG